MEAEPHIAMTTQGTVADASPADRAEGFGGAVAHGRKGNLGAVSLASDDSLEGVRRLRTTDTPEFSDIIVPPIRHPASEVFIGIMLFYAYLKNKVKP